MLRFPKLRSDLIISTADIDGQTVYNIKDPITARFFRLRKPEYWLAKQLDGASSLESIASGFQAKFSLVVVFGTARIQYSLRPPEWIMFDG